MKGCRLSLKVMMLVNIVPFEAVAEVQAFVNVWVAEETDPMVSLMNLLQKHSL